MASGSTSRAEDLPPALPVKQHRASVDSEFSALLSPGGLNDVFVEPKDCLAADCPIHQHYESSQHQARFFSHRTPPPVPRKRFVRTLSFPATRLSLHCPQSPLPKSPQSFDNPLYMLAPMHNRCFHQCTKELGPARRSDSHWSPSFSQLSFDTPDEQLSLVLSACDDQSAVCQLIQQSHLLFLRNLSQSVESRILLREEGAEDHLSSYQPRDFLLRLGSKPVEIGDSVYHRLQSCRFPGRMLALKVHKHASENPTNHQPSHVNVQHTVALFRPAVDVSDPPGGGSTEYSTDPVAPLTTVECFLRKGLTVSVERDLPQGTVEDLVQERGLMGGSEGLDWHRMVCILLQQILLGSRRLRDTGAVADLRPQKIFLVWPYGETSEGPETSRVKEDMEWAGGQSKGIVQMLWRTRGSPRVVIGPQLSDLVAPPSLTSQISSLIKYFLGTASARPDSDQGLVHKVLLDLSSLLQNANSRLHLADMVVMLQVFLWGPHVPLYKDRESTTADVHNWLTTKRALLLTRLAERGLGPEKPALDWEQCMCLQYLSFTSPETIMAVTSQT